jgi:hypothetical protein
MSMYKAPVGTRGYYHREGGMAKSPPRSEWKPGTKVTMPAGNYSSWVIAFLCDGETEVRLVDGGTCWERI